MIDQEKPRRSLTEHFIGKRPPLTLAERLEGVRDKIAADVQAVVWAEKAAGVLPESLTARINAFGDEAVAILREIDRARKSAGKTCAECGAETPPIPSSKTGRHYMYCRDYDCYRKRNSKYAKKRLEARSQHDK